MATFCEEMMMMMEENDIELNLGLSLGGSFMKSEKSISSSAINEKSGETEADLRSILFPISDSVFGEEKKTQIEREVLDPKRKRKILALRRREKKQKMLLETQAEQSRVRDRDSIENETSGSEQICKKAKTDEEEDQGSKQSQSPNRSSSAFVPVVPMQYPFPHLQYVPFSNGFGIPYTVPYWTDPAPVSVSAAAVVGDEKNVFQPVATRAFRPFQAQNAIANRNRSVSCDSEQNGSNGGGLKQSSLCSSGGSLRSGSSGVSDYPSSSNQGISSSSDTRSHSTSSQPTEPFAQGIEEADQKAKKTGQGKPISIDKTITIDKPITITDNPTPPRSPTDQPSHHQTPREAKGEVANKPPKPPQPPQNQQPSKTQALPHMPCVSTTGDGPNGKTISGFLYRYTKTQVSIMCVCHGSSFTPAEFVEHAGGTDVLNPLKHIVVVPSTF